MEKIEFDINKLYKCRNGDIVKFDKCIFDNTYYSGKVYKYEKNGLYLSLEHKIHYNIVCFPKYFCPSNCNEKQCFILSKEHRNYIVGYENEYFIEEHILVSGKTCYYVKSKLTKETWGPFKSLIMAKYEIEEIIDNKIVKINIIDYEPGTYLEESIDD